MSSGTQIARIEAFIVHYPWSGYFKFFEGSRGRAVVFVKITADNGMVGWGQSLPAPKWIYESRN